MADRVPMTSWAGHVQWRASRRHAPTTVAEVQRIVAGARAVGVIGGRHSFTDLADTDGDLLWLGALDVALRFDPARRTVTVPGGVTYHELGPVLAAAGVALANTASLGHVTVAGACATATHGSGEGLGNLATAVRAIELVTADGSLVSLEAGRDDAFPGSVVSLGALGVVTSLTLDVVPAFELTQALYLDVPWPAVFERFDELMGAGYSVSLFPTWRPDVCDRLWVKSLPGDDRADALAAACGARRATAAEVPPTGPDRVLTPFDAVGSWHERLPHFVLHDPDALGDETHAEYFVDRAVAVDAIAAVLQLGERIRPLLDVSELRLVAQDDLWLSPQYERDTVAIHFTWRNDPVAVHRLLPDLEAALEPYAPRPHWGKLFHTSPATLAARYPRLGDFRALCDQFDPTGTFRNRWLRATLFDQA